MNFNPYFYKICISYVFLVFISVCLYVAYMYHSSTMKMLMHGNSFGIWILVLWCFSKYHVIIFLFHHLTIVLPLYFCVHWWSFVFRGLLWAALTKKRHFSEMYWFFNCRVANHAYRSPEQKYKSVQTILREIHFMFWRVLSNLICWTCGIFLVGY